MQNIKVKTAYMAKKAKNKQSAKNEHTKTKGSWQDPYAKREADKYQNPVPSRELISEFLQSQGFPLKYRQICDALGIFDENQLEGLRRRLKAMVRDGQLIRNRKGAFGLVSKMAVAINDHAKLSAPIT